MYGSAVASVKVPDPAGEVVAEQPQAKMVAAMVDLGQAMARQWGFTKAIGAFSHAPLLAAALIVEEALKAAAASAPPALPPPP